MTIGEHILKAAIYARVSTDEQSEKQTIQNQLAACREYAMRLGHEIAEEFLDEGVSGTIPFAERPAGRRLIEGAEAKAFDVVITYRLDRFGRDALVCLLAIERLKPRVALEYVDERFDDTPSGRFAQTVMSAVAQLERDLIRQRTMAGRVRRIANGRYQAPITPYGYVYVKETGQLEPDPETGPVVVQMFNLADSGMGTKAIGLRLDEMGIKPPLVSHPKRKGQYPAWNWSSVYKILRARRYIGEGTYGKAATKVVMACPPLVDPPLFARVQDALTTRKRDSKRNTKGEYLLQHLLYCGQCGGRYSPRTNHTGYRSYACYNRAHAFTNQPEVRAIHPHRWRWPATLLESTVLDWIEGMVWGELALNGMSFEVPDLEDVISQEQMRLDNARNTIANCDERRLRHLDLYGRGKLSESDLDTLLSSIATERQSAEQTVKEAQEALAESVNVKEKARGWLEWLRHHSSSDGTVAWAIEEFRAASFEVKRAFIKLILDRITILGDGELRFEGRIGPGSAPLLIQCR